ncbi:MAG: Flp pilus assembly complex ATPase component TadA [Proteobacteria bacterium]|nr:Flp pilus assembly complex ATPase component TadA [Pseudomonadota bacterium]
MSGKRIVASAAGGGAAAPIAEAVDVSTWGGVRFSKTAISMTDDLAKIVFEKVINDDVKLAPHLFASIAVAKIRASDKLVMLFVDKEKAKREEVEAVVGQLAKRDYRLADTPVQGHFASSGLVMALSQGDITQTSLQFDRDIARDPTKNALMSAFTDVVSWAYANKADDIDFAVDREAAKSQICFKIGGRYIRPERFLLPTDTVVAMLGIAWQKSGGGASPHFDMKVELQALLKINLPRSPAVPEGARVRLRWSSMAIDKGVVVTTRIQRLGESAAIRSLDAAGYLQSQMDIIRRVIRSEGGMVVLAGVVGSGKSTSLVQMINMLPTDIKIQSFEDPVELELKNAYQKTITRDLAQAGDDKAFLSATRALYRSALDVLYMGEIRDRETGLVARQVVESGHSVYTTTHARSGLGIAERFASPAIAINREVLATPGILKLMMYQALLPTNCPHCALSPSNYVHTFTLSPEKLAEHHQYFDRLERLYGVSRDVYRLRNSFGCKYCIKDELPELNGFSGRTVVSELIEPDEQMLEYIGAADGALKLNKYWRSMASRRFDDPDLVGKDTMECAIYKAVRGTTEDGKPVGLIDPREIEPRFMSYETVERRRDNDRASAARRNTNHISVPQSYEVGDAKLQTWHATSAAVVPLHSATREGA